jgi:hypothetical protein
MAAPLRGTRARSLGPPDPDTDAPSGHTGSVLVSNLVVNGVEVGSYVEAELDRRHPVRLLIRSADPADLRQAHQQLQTEWRTTVERLREMPEGSEHRRVGGE